MGRNMLIRKALEDIGGAIQGLEYPSESDQPFEVAQEVVVSGDESMSFEGFFEALRDSDDWPRFEKLKNVLKMYLKDLKVVRVGKIRVQIYVIGHDSCDGWAGVK